MLPSEVLLAARELVAGGWTKGYYARDSSGEEVSGEDESAVCFCSWGALNRVDPGNLSLGESLGFLMAAIAPMAHGNIVRFNDAPTTTHLDVVLAFERAALLAMKEGR